MGNLESERSGFRWAALELLPRRKCEELDTILSQTLTVWTGLLQALLGLQPSLLRGRGSLAGTAGACRGRAVTAKPGNIVYGILCAIKWGLRRRPTSQVTKGRVQTPVPTLCSFVEVFKRAGPPVLFPYNSSSTLSACRR